MKLSNYIIITLLLILGGCKNFNKNVDLALPKFESQVQVECYLDNIREGCKIGGFNVPVPEIKACISKTQDYYGVLDSPFLANCNVNISYNGKTINLLNQNFPDICDTSNYKLFNYKNFTDTFSLIPGTEYSIQVTTKEGKVATAKAKCLNFIKADTIKQNYDKASDRFSIVAEIKDDINQEDYYRARFTNLSQKQGKQGIRDGLLIDGLYNGKTLPFGGSNKEMKEGDTIELVLYHVTQDYYKYYRTLSGAISAAGNPFASPTFIESNIQGGTGIFACLPGTKKRIILKK